MRHKSERLSLQVYCGVDPKNRGSTTKLDEICLILIAPAAPDYPLLVAGTLGRTEIDLTYSMMFAALKWNLFIS